MNRCETCGVYRGLQEMATNLTAAVSVAEASYADARAEFEAAKEANSALQSQEWSENALRACSDELPDPIEDGHRALILGNRLHAIRMGLIKYDAIKRETLALRTQGNEDAALAERTAEATRASCREKNPKQDVPHQLLGRTASQAAIECCSPNAEAAIETLRVIKGRYLTFGITNDTVV